MTKKLAILVILLQLGVLAYMAAHREYIRSTGEIVYFRTMPLDPRDPFRGDFVRLRYDINSISKRHWPERGDNIQKDDVVYTSLLRDPNNVAKFVSVSTSKPESNSNENKNDLFIKGRADFNWRFQQANTIGVRYGIEQFFVQQGVGLDIEKYRGGRTEIQIPMEVEVALSENGTAVTRDFRWSELGVQTEMVRAGVNPLQTNIVNNDQNNDVDPNRNTPPASPRINITIKNVSDKPLALVDNIHHCAFELITADWTDQDYLPASKLCDDYRPSTYGLINLEPEQVHKFEFELSDPRWYVFLNNKPTEIGTLESFPQFRLIYHSPTPEQVEQLMTDKIIWQGDLPSQAFNASGRID
ncbi:GDYXXLXY domain-containing protein [Aurantivibrio infirmus]